MENWLFRKRFLNVGRVLQCWFFKPGNGSIRGGKAERDGGREIRNRRQRGAEDRSRRIPRPVQAEKGKRGEGLNGLGPNSASVYHTYGTIRNYCRAFTPSVSESGSRLLYDRERRGTDHITTDVEVIGVIVCVCFSSFAFSQLVRSCLLFTLVYRLNHRVSTRIHIYPSEARRIAREWVLQYSRAWPIYCSTTDTYTLACLRASRLWLG